MKQYWGEGCAGAVARTAMLTGDANCHYHLQVDGNALLLPTGFLCGSDMIWDEMWVVRYFWNE